MKKLNNVSSDPGSIRLMTSSPTDTDSFRRKEKKHEKKAGLIAVLAAVLFFLTVFSFLFIVPYREFSFTPAWIFAHVKTRFGEFYKLLTGTYTPFYITVCQYVAIIFVGAALAATGCIFQSGFRNHLAGPSTMGVMSGGTLGCMLYLLCFTEVSTGQAVSAVFDATAYASRTMWDIYGQQACTLLGCFLAVALVLGLATVSGRGRLSSNAMILSGTVFASLTGTFSMLIQYYMILTDPTDTRIDAVRDLMMGSFDSITSWRTVFMLCIPLTVCLVILLCLRSKLDLFSLSEDEALSMGIDIRKFRYGIVALGTVLTALVVAFCGHVGFIGFMIPLAGRRIAGPGMKKLLPVCMLMGSVLLMLIFDCAYVAQMTSYLNLFTGILGSIVMVAVLFRREGGGSHGTEAIGRAGAVGAP